MYACMHTHNPVTKREKSIKLTLLFGDIYMQSGISFQYQYDTKFSRGSISMIKL